jgi:hypothetical protein
MLTDPNYQCPFCQTRALLRQSAQLLETAPVIGAEFYDETISDIINDMDNAQSTFQCYCNEPEKNETDA